MNGINIFKPFYEQALAHGASASWTLNLERYNVEGFFSIQSVFTVANAGTLELIYTLSNDGVNFVVPVDVDPIFSDLAPSTALYSFEPMVAKYIRLTVNEDSAGTGTIVSLSSHLAIQ